MWGCDRAPPRLFTPLPAVAQSAPQESTPRAQLRVGVSNTPPFAIETKTDSGSDWDGIGVHLWREVAEELDIQYKWQSLLKRFLPKSES